MNKSNQTESNEQRSTTPVVDEISKLNFSGNIIPHSWYSHEIMRYDPSESDITKWAKAKDNDKMTYMPVGKPYALAIILLSDCLYWYRAIEIRDEATNRVLGFQRKFYADKLQKSYKQWAEAFGFTKGQVEDAVGFLKDRGLISVELRTVYRNRRAINNVMFIEPIPENVKLLTESQTITIGEKAYHVITPYQLITGEPTTLEHGTNTETTNKDNLTILNNINSHSGEESTNNFEDQNRSQDSDHDLLLGSKTNDLMVGTKQEWTKQYLVNSEPSTSENDSSIYVCAEPELDPNYFSDLAANEAKYREDGYVMPTWKTEHGEELPVYQSGKRPGKSRDFGSFDKGQVYGMVETIVEAFGYQHWNCPRNIYGLSRDFVERLVSDSSLEDWADDARNDLLADFVGFLMETFRVTPYELPDFVTDFRLYSEYVFKTGIRVKDYVYCSDGSVTLDWVQLIEDVTGERASWEYSKTYTLHYEDVDAFTEKLFVVYPYRIVGDGVKVRGDDLLGNRILRDHCRKMSKEERREFFTELWDSVQILKNSRRIPKNFENFLQNYVSLQKALI